MIANKNIFLILKREVCQANEKHFIIALDDKGRIKERGGKETRME